MSWPCRASQDLASYLHSLSSTPFCLKTVQEVKPPDLSLQSLLDMDERAPTSCQVGRLRSKYEGLDMSWFCCVYNKCVNYDFFCAFHWLMIQQFSSIPFSCSRASIYYCRLIVTSRKTIIMPPGPLTHHDFRLWRISPSHSSKSSSSSLMKPSDLARRTLVFSTMAAAMERSAQLLGQSSHMVICSLQP